MDESFILDRNIRLIGGFDGIEDEEAFINPVQNLTILSGDIPMEGRAWHILWGDDTPWNGNTEIIGFTITGAGAEDDPENAYGGGIWTEAELTDGPHFKTCRFVDNTASQGGAVGTRSVDMDFRDCVFLENLAVASGGAISGYSLMGFSKCEFRENATTDTETWGGAIDLGVAPDYMVNCKFVGNVTDGSFILGQGGGAIFVSYDDATPTNCVFLNNSCDSYVGGGIQLGASGVDDFELTLINCTFAGNESYDSGAGAYTDGSMVIGNSILYFNTASSSQSEDAQYIASDGATITYSDIQNQASSSNGNIDEDPEFLDLMNGDLRLDDLSDCIDAGSNGLLPADVGDVDDDLDFMETLPCDIRLVNRIENSVVDMGAYEGNDNCFADLNASGGVDGADLGLLLAEWGTDDHDADLNDDGLVDGADLGLLLSVWGTCTPHLLSGPSGPSPVDEALEALELETIEDFIEFLGYLNYWEMADLLDEFFDI